MLLCQYMTPDMTKRHRGRLAFVCFVTSLLRVSHVDDYKCQSGGVYKLWAMLVNVIMLSRPLSALKLG